MTETVPAGYPNGITQTDHIAHDMRMGRFPEQSTIAQFLAERDEAAPALPTAEADELQAAPFCPGCGNTLAISGDADPVTKKNWFVADCNSPGCRMRAISRQTSPTEAEAFDTFLTAALATTPETARLPQDVIDLVIAGRIVAFDDQSPEALFVLDTALEAFASRVPWDDEPTPPSTAKSDTSAADEARITLVLRGDDTVATHTEAAPGADPATVLDRAISALQAERKALGACPVHQTPTFLQEVSRLAHYAESIGRPLDRRLRYGFNGEPLYASMADGYRRRASFWLNAAAALRMLAEKARKEEMFDPSSPTANDARAKDGSRNG